MSKQRTRRDLLRVLGASSVTGATLLAGCTGDGGGGGTTTETTTTTATTTEATTTTTSEATTEETTTETTTTTAAERTITDAVGRSVTVPGSVDRTIGLGPGALRVIAYLNATDSVVGVERLETTNKKRPYRPYVVANPGLADVAAIGTRKEPDPELIIERDPDVVFWSYAKKKKANRLQSQIGIPVVSLDPGDLDPNNRSSFFDTLELVGGILGADDRAAELTDAVQSTVADLNDRSSGVSDPPSAYVGYLGRGKHGFPYTQPAYPPFSLLNANNVASPVATGKYKKGVARVTVDPEQIIAWDPEYVFVDLGTESYDALAKPEYESITAIEEGNVYGVLPNRDYAINFGTVMANTYYIGSVLFPENFSDVDPTAKANEIYETLLGEGIYQQVADAYGGGGFHRMEVE